MPQIIRLAHITRQFVREHRSTIFVFGDNLQERGYGGQAAAMRGEPNSVGIPTKHAPHNRPSAFFDDRDFNRIRPFIDKPFDRLQFYLKYGRQIVVPKDGIGTGLADLQNKAPRIFDYIQRKFAELEKLSKSRSTNGETRSRNGQNELRP